MSKTERTLPAPARRRIPINQLRTREADFQPRTAGLHANHVAALADVLSRGGQLDPVAVWEDPATEELVVADGHHRLEAYRRQRHIGSVPALVFRCDRRTAALIPMADNVKNRLQLCHTDKANWAWRMTRDGEWSKAQTRDTCGISDGTVATMRRAKKALRDRGESLPDTWERARAAWQNESPSDWTEEQREAWLEELVARADHNFGSSLTHLIKQSPEAAASLLERCAGGQLATVLDYIGFVEADPTDPYEMAGGTHDPATF